MNLILFLCTLSVTKISYELISCVCIYIILLSKLYKSTYNVQKNLTLDALIPRFNNVRYKNSLHT